MEGSSRDLAVFTRRGKVRQRARLACEKCRHKRIKCSAGVSGIPCDNCQDDPGSCRLVQSRRLGRKAPSSSTENAPGGIGTTSESPVSIRTPVTRENSRRHGVPHSDSSSGLDDSNNLYAQILDEEPARSSGAQVVYLGETFNLTHLLYTTNPHSRRAHAYHRPTRPLPSTSRSTQISDETLDILNRQRAFELPPQDVIHDLFKAYFDYAYPHNPIISRVSFARAYYNNRSPPSFLLLQSVLFAAVGHCDISVIKRAGFENRYAARAELFRRAKALYDADHETDKVTLVQSLFLISAWWNSPTDQKDTWHWIGAATCLAVTMGMHRSTKESILTLHDQRLWRRIWWALFTEDKHASAALGRPVQTRLRDCDVEPLTEEDFYEDPLSPAQTAVFGTPCREHTLYVIHLSELSKIVERIIDSSHGSLGGQITDRMTALMNCEMSLKNWTTQIPPDFAISRGLWSRMLFAAHSWFRILTYRLIAMVPPHETSQNSRQTTPQGEVIEATNTITRIVEQTLSQDEITHCPIHIIPAMFAAMGMHAIDICDGQGSPLREQLGYVKLRMCMIALRELKGIWPLSGWIFVLFTRIVNRIRDRDREYLADGNTNGALRSAGPASPSINLPNLPMESLPSDPFFGAMSTSTIGGGGGGMSSLFSMPLDFSADLSDVMDVNGLFDLDADFNAYSFP